MICFNFRFLGFALPGTSHCLYAGYHRSGHDCLLFSHPPTDASQVMHNALANLPFMGDLLLRHCRPVHGPGRNFTLSHRSC